MNESVIVLLRVVLALFLVLGWTWIIVWEIKPKRLWFRIYFGTWPEKDGVLKNLVRRQYVEPKLRSYAEALNNAYLEQTKFLQYVRDDKVSLKEAKKELSRTYRQIKRAEIRFYLAQQAAVRYTLVTAQTYKFYITPVAQPVGKAESK